MTTLPALRRFLCMVVLAAASPFAQSAPAAPSAPVASSAHDEDTTDLFRWIDIDNARGVAQLLKQGMDPNTRDVEGQVALYVALRAQSLKVANSACTCRSSISRLHRKVKMSSTENRPVSVSAVAVAVLSSASGPGRGGVTRSRTIRATRSRKGVGKSGSPKTLRHTSRVPVGLSSRRSFGRTTAVSIQ